MSKQSIGWALIVAGGICVAIAMIKLSIIGYYPDEFLPFMILAVVGLGGLWVGDRFRKQAAIDADKGTEQ
ncbi:hypothetical protein [Microbacterium sp.]|uniref:hypothetical protein n=1 Tax=Microbacterium sp. TaxID=51671 RepID=UPI0039E4D1C3